MITCVEGKTEAFSFLKVSICLFELRISKNPKLESLKSVFILVSKWRNFLRFGDTIVKFRRVPLTNRQGGLDPFGLVFGVLDGVLSYASVLRTIVFYALGVSRYRNR